MFPLFQNESMEIANLKHDLKLVLLRNYCIIIKLIRKIKKS